MVAPSRLRLLPLGGLGQIGMNCLALEQGSDIVLIDCGVQYPDGDYGIDIVHPDFSWLLRHQERLRGVVLTHGHEDHIGALPYLLQQVQVPVWGSRHALRLVGNRLAESARPCGEVDLREVLVREPFDVGSFRFEALRVTHSIVEATALAITTSAGVVVHTGDFKFDCEPSDGQLTDEARLEELGDEGVALLLSDSTNVNVPGWTRSEKEVDEALEVQISNAKERVFVALFASNVQRLISLGRIARDTSRRICLLGRSITRHVELAQELGYLDWPKSLMLGADKLSTYPRAEVMVLAGGSQAEAGSALARIAEGSHRFIQLAPGDTVVFSSRVIPGNERGVSQMVGALLRHGAKLVAGSEVAVHTSGHAYQDEQRHMLQLIKPRNFLPVHGTLQHLQRHAELARAEGIPNVLVVENGESIILDDAEITKGDRFESGQVTTGLDGLPIAEATLRERCELGRSGLVSVALFVNSHGKLIGEPKIDAVGLRWSAAGARDSLVAELSSHWPPLSRQSLPNQKHEIAKLVRHWCAQHLCLRPAVVVHISAQ